MNSRSTTLPILLLLSVCGLALGQNTGAPAVAAPAADAQEPVYVCPPCPADCHSLTFSKPGSCPICGMLLIRKVAAPAGHTEAGAAGPTEEADRLFTAREYQAAADAYRRITEADPANALAWRRLGYCLHVTGKLDDALAAHRRAAEFPAERPRALFNIACLHSARKELDPCFDALTQAIDAGFTARYYLEEDAELANARKDARFAPLLAKIDAAEQAAAARRIQVGVVVHEGVELLDFAGPAEVFANARGPNGAGFHVFTVAPKPGPADTQQGVVVQPRYTLDDCPKIDVLVIPGGATQNLTRDAKFMAWVKERVPQTQVTLTVCTGAFTLADQGLLDGLSATTHYSAISGLRSASDKINVLENVRFVDNGRIVTAAGISAGIDGALHVVARLISEEAARATARQMEYDWRQTTGPGAAGGTPKAGSMVAAQAPQSAAQAGHAPEEAAAEPLFQAALVAARQGDEAATLQKIDAALAAGACPTRVTVEAAFAGLHGDARFADLIRRHARQSGTRIAPDGEPGDKLIVRGIVRDSAGRPVANALIFAFQVDARGYYSRNGMDEENPRLFGYMRTDAGGNYSLITIRPAHYATAPDEIEQHIHFQVTTAGDRSQEFRLGFADDPIWKTLNRAPPAWAVMPKPDANGTPVATFDMSLR